MGHGEFIVIDGEVLAQQLEAMGAAARKVGRQALEAGGEPMLAAIRGRIHDVTGTLSRGLEIRPGRGDRPGRISMLIQSWGTRARFARTRSSGVAARVRALGGARDRYRNWYDLPVEFGHANASGGGRTPEHPFARPGFDTTEEATAEGIEAELFTALDAV
jgi:hypothetical protein